MYICIILPNGFVCIPYAVFSAHLPQCQHPKILYPHPTIDNGIFFLSIKFVFTSQKICLVKTKGFL